MGIRILAPDEFDQDIIYRTANEAIDQGAIVKYHTDGKKAVELDASDLLDLGFGVALSAAASGEEFPVCKRGVCDVLVDGTSAVAIGDRLVASGSAAGVLIKDGTVAVADVNQLVTPLEAQATAAATLTMCKVNLS